MGVCEEEEREIEEKDDGNAKNVKKEGCFVCVFFFFKQKTADEMLRSLVGSEMCIRDRLYRQDDRSGAAHRSPRDRHYRGGHTSLRHS